jgi:peptidoglycan/LPS O-acetylase OafA/YrhL
MNPGNVLTQTERLHGLDALRGFALLLGVALHASMSFLPGAQYVWVTSDLHASVGVGLFFFVPHMFRMLLFFLLAGFFGRLLCERLGTRGFVRDRWQRIAKPLLIFWLPLFAAIIAVLAWGAMRANGGEMPKETPPGPSFLPNDFPLTHLWFLYELLLCYGAMLLARALGQRLDRAQRAMGMLDRAVRLVLHPAGVTLIAAPLMLAFWLEPKWYAWFGIPTPDHTLYPNLPVLASYWLAFALGWLLQGQRAPLAGLAARWPWYLGLALLLSASSLALVGLTPPLVAAPHDAHTLAYVAAYALAAWCWTFGLIGAALRWCAGHSPLRRYLADASYWIYLMHLPLVMALQVWLRELDASPWLKFAAILGATVLALLASYALIVRNTWIGAMLNGRRKPRRCAVPVINATSETQ